MKQSIKQIQLFLWKIVLAAHGVNVFTPVPVPVPVIALFYCTDYSLPARENEQSLLLPVMAYRGEIDNIFPLICIEPKKMSRKLP